MLIVSVSLQSFLTLLNGFQIVFFGTLKVLRKESVPSPCMLQLRFHLSRGLLVTNAHLNRGLHYWKQLKMFNPFSP